MAKITIASIVSGFRSVTAFNTNFQSITTDLNNKVLYRDNPGGEPNEMKNSLDMNSHTILNLPVPLTGTEPVRFDQITALIAGGAIPIQEEGTDVVGIPTKLNFIGTNVTVTDVSGVATITFLSTPVQEEGTEITADPVAINFVGDNVTVTDIAGTATVTITDTSTYLALTDTPSSFSGSAKKIARVNAAGTAIEFVIPELDIPTEQTGTTYTTVLGDANSLVRMNNASANIITIPPNSSVAYPIGSVVSIVQIGAGTTTVAEGSGVTINSADSFLAARARYSTLSVMKILADTWILTGDLA